MPYKHDFIKRSLERYITIRNYCGAGRSHIEWIINAFKMGGYVVLYLVFLGFTADDFPSWFIFSLGIGFLIICYMMGWGWDRFKGYELEATWGNKRNPMLREMSEKLK